MTSGMTGSEPKAPVPMISLLPPQGRSSSADNGVCPNSSRYRFDGFFFRFPYPATVDDDVVLVGTAVDLDCSEST